MRPFLDVEKIQKQKQYKKDKKGNSFDVKSEYTKVTQKNQILLKSYAANYNRLLSKATLENEIS